jgi:hypothetical protein
MLASTSAASAAEALHLVQRAELSGLYDLYFSDNAIKAINSKTGIILYSRAPHWELLICNSHRKVYATMPCEKFTGKLVRAIVTFDTEIIDSLKWTVYKKEKLWGRPVIRLHVNVKEAQIHKYAEKNRTWTGEYVELDQKAIPVPVCHALQRLYGVALQNSIPIAFAYFNSQGEKTSGLDTFKCNRVKYDMNYSVPAGYKRVHDELELSGTQSNSALEFFRP